MGVDNEEADNRTCRDHRHGVDQRLYNLGGGAERRGAHDLSVGRHGGDKCSRDPHVSAAGGILQAGDGVGRGFGQVWVSSAAQ